MEDVVTLLPLRCHDGELSLRELASVHAVDPTADAAPNHGMSQHPLRSVIRPVDSRIPREGPQPSLEFEDLEAGRRCFCVQAPRAIFEDLLDLPP
jgi:hypothetical protein